MSYFNIDKKENQEIFEKIITIAWAKLNPRKKISHIEDFSAKVSTNRVFKVSFMEKGYIIAKLSHFGRHEHFVEDHQIVNILANNLLYPFDRFIARALLKGDSLFSYRHKEKDIDVWIVFYNPIRKNCFLPKILSNGQIMTLAKELALFHKSCTDIIDELPQSSKTMERDIQNFMNIISENGYNNQQNKELLLKQCSLFLTNSKKYKTDKMESLPVFIDWNIGNFSVDKQNHFYSRWDYDWFRMSPRMMDFYFWARVVRAEGDKTSFSYGMEPFFEERFILFLKHYHQINPLDTNEILYLKECYRFFILQYVVNLGKIFFLPEYGERLIKESFDNYFKNIDTFDMNKIIHSLSLN